MGLFEKLLRGMMGGHQSCGAAVGPAQCASCETAIAAGAKFCARCGKPPG